MKRMLAGLFAIVIIFEIFPKELHSKVLIMTHCYNKPEYIVWQHKTFAKFLKDEYEFVVFNDTPNEILSRETQHICDSLGITSIRVPQKIHRPPYYFPRPPGIGGASAECAETIQYMMDSMGFDHNGIVLLIDSDMFLIKYLKIEEFLNEYDIASHANHRVGSNGTIAYMLPNLMFFNMNALKDKRELNFNLGTVDGAPVDTGGFTHYYLKNHPSVRWRSITITTTPYKHDFFKSMEGFIPPHIISYLSQGDCDHEYYEDFTFMHFRAGSNWNNLAKDAFEKKIGFLCGALDLFLNVNPSQ